MSAIKPVSPEVFGGKFWKHPGHYLYAAGFNIVPIAIAELPKVTGHLPLAFTQLDGQWQLVAITSLHSGVNHLVGPSGQWLGGYVPAIFRAYPFTLSKAGPKDSDGFILCSMDSGEHLVGEGEGGEPFFDESGQASEAVRRAGNFMVEIEASRVQTVKAVAALIEAKVVVAWDLSASHNGVDQKVTGFYRLDEAAFANLPSAAVAKLQAAGALPVAYAQWYSRESFSRLQQAINEQGRLRAAAA